MRVLSQLDASVSPERPRDVGDEPDGGGQTPHARSAARACSGRICWYVAAVAAAAGAFLVRAWLWRYMGPRYVLFFPTVMIVALLGGLGPGLVATAASALLAALLILPAERQFGPIPIRDVVGLLLFVVGGVLMSFVAHLYRKARRRVLELERSRVLHETGERVRASEQRLRAIMDTIPDPVFLKDRDSRLVLANPATLQAIGKPAAEVLGRSDRDLFEDPDVGVAIVATDRRIMQSGAPEVVEERVQTPGGYRVFLSTKAPYRDTEGRVVGLVGVARDITDRKKVEEALAVHTRLYAVLSRVNETIVRTRSEQSLLEGVCRILSDDGAFPLAWVGAVRGRQIVPVTWSGPESDYVGSIKVEIDGPLGQGPMGTCVREDRPVLNYDFATNPAAGPWRAKALSHGLRTSVAFPLHRQHGVIAALIIYSRAPHAFPPEQLGLLEGLCADVSYALDAMEQERLRAEAEQALRESERNLRDVDRHRNEFLGVLSHELRNPLAPIRNALFLLDKVAPGGEQAARAKAVLGRQVDHLTRLVDDLLDVTRISRGKITLHRHRFDLCELVPRTVEDYRQFLAERDIAVDVSVPSGKVEVEADATRISQVVGNLLQNSAKFTDRGGRVLVTVEAERDRASVRVRDTGIGVASDMLGRMFEPFTQAEQSLQRGRGGLGLGLALVKGLVELHGGTVDAASEGIGCGTEIVVRLPLAPERVEAPLASPPARVRERSPHRVLVIEDNADAAETLREMLELWGHEVDVANAGRCGVERARAFRPDVVLCDIGLPEMDGYEVARSLRSDPSMSTVVLVAVTGYALPEDQRRAAEAGFDFHIAKPVSSSRIEDVLTRAPGAVRPRPRPAEADAPHPR